jgi:hypothetical protein
VTSCSGRIQIGQKTSYFIFILFRVITILIPNRQALSSAFAILRFAVAKDQHKSAIAKVV